MKLSDWQNKRIVILGFGREGQATLRYLSKHLAGARIAVADRRKLEDMSEVERGLLEQSEVEKVLGENYLDGLEKFELIIKSPGINPRQAGIQKALQAGVEMTSATRMFFGLKKGKVVAVTGSKGKSTTASLVYAVLKEGGLQTELIGNIGRAALDFLETDAEEKVYVFEMSSYQLEDFSDGAEVSVMVSFFPEHLDYHGSLEAYFQAKMQLMANPRDGQVIIWNAGNKTLREYMGEYAEKWRARAGGPRLVGFNDGGVSTVVEDGKVLVARAGGLNLINDSEIRLKGKHNLENILAVYEVAKIFKISLENFRKALINFSPLEHRLEPVGTYRGIIFYNDAISTTPESTMAAIDALSRQKQISTLIAGGLDRGYNFDQLAVKILEAGIKNLILLPETGKKIAEAVGLLVQKNGIASPLLTFVDKMESCVEKAFEVSVADSICLLSCASPSFNLFKNFEDRGRQFKDAVRKN